jgi:excisionase family DNA binding protein
MTFTELPEVLTPAIIAKYMRIGRGKVYEYLRTPVKQGGIPYMMCGTHMRILKRDFQRWLDYQVSLTQKPRLKAVK